MLGLVFQQELFDLNKIETKSVKRFEAFILFIFSLT